MNSMTRGTQPRNPPDLANAVLDGVDGFLLGQETLRGQFPIVSVQTIVSIAKQAEKVFDHHYHFDHLMDTAVEVGVQIARLTAQITV